MPFDMVWVATGAGWGPLLCGMVSGDLHHNKPRLKREDDAGFGGEFVRFVGKGLPRGLVPLAAVDNTATK